MKRLALAVAVALTLTLTATAQAHTKRLAVDQTARWETPQTYGPHATVTVDVYVNGHPARAAYRPKWGLGYCARGVVVEAHIGRKGPILFRIANARERSARIRLEYRRYEPVSST